MPIKPLLDYNNMLITYYIDTRKLTNLKCYSNGVINSGEISYRRSVSDYVFPGATTCVDDLLPIGSKSSKSTFLSVKPQQTAPPINFN